MVKQLIAGTLMVPVMVMGRHKRREGRTVISFTEGYHGLRASSQLEGTNRGACVSRIGATAGGPDVRHVQGVRQVVNWRAPPAGSIAHSHERADQLDDQYRQSATQPVHADTPERLCSGLVAKTA
jgi:hypothetical protein